uniref:1-phosphatidylinositol 4,5-bisphosphate phosphodiesterase n=1 Tax=Spodoptera littoralis TaxID=7109 RepID=B3G506_SPOLI|nr:phospholipase C [Spodoptera littoralis]
MVEAIQTLQDGEKFWSWDDDSGAGTPVTLRVDFKGFFLYWVDQNNEFDILDFATIRDVRTGQYAKFPKDFKLRQIVTVGCQDTLEEKTVTVCHGSDFVNMTFRNFCCTRFAIAPLWTDTLIQLAYCLAQLNGSAIMFLQKAHTKLCLQVDKSGRIPVKNIIKHFAQNKEDRKRVEKALDVSGLPSGKVDSCSLLKFQFEDFFNLYKCLTQTSEVERLFDSIVGNSKRKCMSDVQLVEFLNKTQRDPRLNEILYPYANGARATELIQQYEPNKFNAQKGQLSLDGFLRYLMFDDNPIMACSKLDLSDDMDQPMSHYFINSSHNTYLTGHQLTGKSSVEIYRQCLLAGCRCVELDFWNGRTEEPVIVHGYTFVPEIHAKDVLEAIAESAFKTSEYPVILSFENHCNPRQQAKIANYCREIFGDMLLDKPLDSHQLEPGGELPPPSLLRNKIIIKNKKKHHHHHKKEDSIASEESEPQPEVPQGNGDVTTATLTRQGSSESSDSESSSGEEEAGGADSAAGEDARETHAGAEISALVNYVQPVHFSSFENSEKKNRFYEMSSFDEKQATTLLKERPIEFVNYNKHQLSRVYPAGTRFDSSNFMPQVFWNAGCQLVALNYQTLDLAMQLNLGTYEYHRRCGYLLKPEFMRRKDRRLDPFAESTVDGIIAGTVHETVLSGQFLTDKRLNTFVEVDMYGLPADTVRKKFRTKEVRDNGANPDYDEEPFVFKKVVLPELASIRIAAYEEGGKLIGHRVLPVIGLCPGYRHVMLREEVGQPIGLASLFLCVVVKDYVPDCSFFAEALANPIKYQSEDEKRQCQLCVLTDCQEDPIQETADEDFEKSFVFVFCGETKKSPECRPSISAHLPTVVVVADEFHHILPVACNNQFQQSLDHSFGDSAFDAPVTSFDCDAQVAEPLEKIFENKGVKEKRLEMEKKLDQVRKKHDKEKAKIEAPQKSVALTGLNKKQKFHHYNKLVKRLSSKHACQGHWAGAVVLPYVWLIGATNDYCCVVMHGVQYPDHQKERLRVFWECYGIQYRELQEKYHEDIYPLAEKVLQYSQWEQMKQLKHHCEPETEEVMPQLQEDRKFEVKQLAAVHKDKDELNRMKREVASSPVEKGVEERVRLLKETYERTDELQKQHDSVLFRVTALDNTAWVRIHQLADNQAFE